MARRIPATPPSKPEPRRPDPNEFDDGPTDDEGGTDDFDETEVDDDLDWVEDQEWPDDEPLPDPWEPDDDFALDDDRDPLLAPDDEPDEPGLLDDLTDERELSEDLELDEPEDVLPWRMTAQLPDLGLELPAVLDPTCATSTWVGGPPDLDGPVAVALGPHRLLVTLVPAPGDAARLRLGRDALRGRIAVSSGDLE